MVFSKDLPFTCLITEGKLTTRNFKDQKEQILKIVGTAVRCNISAIQIREKNLPAKLVFDLAREILKITNNSNTKVLINDRFDLAIASGAGGVHLTSNSIPTRIVRKLCPPSFIIGVSTHNLKKAQKAQIEGADFVTFSPIFFTSSKAEYGKPKGIDELRKVCHQLKPFPVIALGGINENNFRLTLESGAGGFASIGFLNNRKNLRKLKL